MTPIDPAAIAKFKASPAYLALGICGRERALYAAFPALAAQHRKHSSHHLFCHRREVT